MERIIFVVDDDDSVRQSVVSLLRSAGHTTKEFSSGEAFLSEPIPTIPACLVLDMRLKTSSGFDVLDALAAKGAVLPVIFMTAFGSIPMTVRAMKAGAQEFLTKPIASEDLLRAIDEALELAQKNLQSNLNLLDSTQRYETLTQREREVLTLAIGGLMIKQIAGELGIQEVTAKVHKQKIMEKMGTKSLADLVRVAERLNIVSEKSRYSSKQA